MKVAEFFLIHHFISANDAHYHLWIPDSIDEVPGDEEETLSLHADSEEHWGDLMEIECRSATHPGNQTPVVSTNQGTNATGHGASHAKGEKPWTKKLQHLLVPQA